MPYLTEACASTCQGTRVRIPRLRIRFDDALNAADVWLALRFFLSHSIRDAEPILGLKAFLEAAGRSVYVDWITDPQLDRKAVSGATAEALRSRMRQCDSLFYVYLRNSQCSRWMPWGGSARLIEGWWVKVFADLAR